jgi:hypothetical protein
VFGSTDLEVKPESEDIWAETMDVAPFDLAVGDLDGVGFDDIAVSGPMIFQGAPEPSHTAEWFVSTAAADEPIAVADHNGDGALDLVVATSWYEGMIVPGQQTALNADGDELEVITLAH